MNKVVSYDVTEGVATLTINNPPVNVLTRAVRQGLWEAMEQAGGDPDVGAVLIRADGKAFLAGADIRELGKRRTGPQMADICTRIATCTKPVVAAINGSALGGGFELALACHFRIAHKNAVMGLPEVTLGLLPSAGATQRLPRLAGAEPALVMMLTGRPIDAETAHRLNLIDKVIEGNLDKAGFGTARNMAGAKTPPRPTCGRNDGFSDPSAYLEAVNAKRGEATGAKLMAPERILECVEAAMLLPFEAGLQLEQVAFEDCVSSDASRALRHVFKAERKAALVPEMQGAVLRKITEIGVVGGGLMGAGIAVTCLNAGYPVSLIERDQEAADQAKARIEAIYQRLVEKARLSDKARHARLSKLTCGTDYGALAQADLVIEAVSEQEEVKHAAFARLDAVLKPGAILATNTSYMDIDALGATTSRAADVVGYHFFSPAHIMKLLEVVVGKKTAPDVVATGFALAKALGKVPVRAGVSDGFIGNRILTAYRSAADFMLEDGVSPAEIDAAMRDYGFPMGPYQVLDMAGLDISWERRKRLAPSRDPKARYVAIGDRLCERGWFGQKSGRGYYRYEAGTRNPVEDPDVLALIAAERKARSITPRRFTAEQIQHRCAAAMANEGARLLGEGVALRPSDIDVAMIHGFGFPRWRGGPMKAADLRGLLPIENQIRSYQPEAPEFWKLSRLFDELVKNGMNFESMNLL